MRGKLCFAWLMLGLINYPYVAYGRQFTYEQFEYGNENGSILSSECPIVAHSDAFKACAETAKPDTGQCYEEERAFWDKKLNLTYKKLLDYLESASHTDSKNIDHNPYDSYSVELNHLKESQRLWLKFRDANCEFIQDEPKGIPGVSKIDCLLQMTIMRTNELERMLPESRHKHL